jgi:DNA-binding NtrC family response regulator
MPLTILIVDDHDGMSRTLQDILQDEGHQVLTADSGSSAIELSGTTPVDLAMLDLRLPDMDGVELFRQLREHTPAIKAIMMSAYMDVGLQDAALKMGAIAFLHKPLDIEQVLNLVSRMPSS